MGMGQDGSGWIGMDQDRLGCVGVDWDGSGWVRKDQDGSGWIRMGQEGSGRIGMGQEGLGWIRMDQGGSGWVGMDQGGSGWIRVDQDGSGRIRMDQDGSGWIQMDRDGSGWIRMGGSRESCGWQEQGRWRRAGLGGRSHPELEPRAPRWDPVRGKPRSGLGGKDPKDHPGAATAAPGIPSRYPTQNCSAFVGSPAVPTRAGDPRRPGRPGIPVPGRTFPVQTFRRAFQALLQARGLARTDPAGFLGARRRHGERLLVVVRNEDVSCHIHTVPSLLELKRCPGVVFAGVDDAEELSGDTFQELFQAGGFVVSDEELLDSVTLGQLLQVVKVLEKLNRHGRWKWLLHHGESRRLRGDPRDDARRKQLLLRRCQGEELLELLPFHACDRGAAAARRVPCLLELQVRHVHARFAVFLTENAGGSREILESRGILVADVSTFLGTVQELAAPFRRSYW